MRCLVPTPQLDTHFFRRHSIYRLHEGYAREFTKFKPDKKLQWLSHLGTVQLDIELEDRIVSAEVAPLEAALIELFSNRRAYSRNHYLTLPTDDTRH